jgi:hypothetical protein
VDPDGDIASGDVLTGEFIAVPRGVALGDQTALENWSNANNVFRFIRVEDATYDNNTPHTSTLRRSWDACSSEP